MHENRLIHEKSPYLQQHAHNPVDWFPWGAEAFERARKENKPIFLSIGYSTCHWCHVMERESFENQQIADILNRYFVSIKVDREERPDIDRIYMTYVQASTGSGGWPMSVWLTPDLKPFVGGTYFPPENKYGRPGFPVILERVAEAWKNDREKIIESSAAVLSQLRKQAEIAPSGSSRLDPGALDTAFNVWRRSFDSKLGGFGDAPKFPRPVIFNFLLRYYARTKNQEALEMTADTLKAMAKGGMHDQLGGGFHRYSVDEYWFVPHFEKMLYDQAQLAVAYLETYQITQDPLYAEIARRTLDYVLRDMQDPAGGFFSAEDADSAGDPAHPDEKSEGAFYIWTETEIENIAGQPSAKWFSYRYGVEEHGNVQHDPHGEFHGHNILFEAHSVDETAHHFEAPASEVRAGIDAAAKKLLESRSHRVRPHLDDKVLTAWNGLMISAFAKGGAILGDARYQHAARRAADFSLTKTWDSRSGVLLRRYRQGETAIPGFLDDYAFLAQGLLDLYETQFQFSDLEAALSITEAARARFEDREHGAFFNTAAGEEELLMRMKEDHDGAEPSGNSVMALNLLRLGQITGSSQLRAAADRTLDAFGSRILGIPAAVPQMLVAYGYSLAKPKQIILAGEKSDPNLGELLSVLQRRFVPVKIVILADEQSRPHLARWIPGIESMRPIDGQAAAFVCEDYACKLPTTKASKLSELLQ